MPSTPADNKTLLMESIRCDDPVVYLEHKGLWDLEGTVDDDAEILPIGKARVAKKGSDVTIVSWSAMFHTSMEAAEGLEAKGVDAEVIDLRTLWPWDKKTIFKSIRKTGHLVVAHEAVQVGGFGAEIVATVTENVFSDLKSAPLRIAAPRIPISYAPTMESEVRITADQIIEATLKRVGK
jgi:pyruvate dehydrogenase E1 component beta subunit